MTLRPEPRRPGIDDDPWVTPLPVFFGLLGGLATGILGLLVLGRLTINSLYGWGLSGTIVNAVLGCLLSAAIGAVAATLARRGATGRDLGPGGSARTGRLAGIGAVVITVGLGMTVPLHMSVWFLELVVGIAAAWWTSGLSSRR